MYATSSTQRLGPPAGVPGPRAARQDGLPVDEVLAHVARRAANAADARPRLIAALEACARLIGARQRLILTLDRQHHVEQLAQLADGRERARGRPSSPRAALGWALEAVRERTARALAEWREASQRFTSATHLLPAQLPHQLPQAPALTAAEREALMQAHARAGVAGALDGFDAALLRYSDAHRRCEQAAARASRTRSARATAESAWRMGQGSLSGVAQACLADLSAAEELFEAEASRAAARGRLCALAGHMGWQAPL